MSRTTGVFWLLIIVLVGCLHRPSNALPPKVAHDQKEVASSLENGIAPNKLSASQALDRLKQERDPFWERASEEVYADSAETLSKHLDERAKKLGLLKIVHGSPERKEIALTFDDGPHREFTPRLLDVLKKEGVKATFFTVGFMAERQPDLVRRMVAEGHEVGNHTYHHVSLPKIDLKYVADEIEAQGDVIRSITGRRPTLFRPPGGRYNPDIVRIAADLGYTTVLWTVDPGDFQIPNTNEVIKDTISSTRNGGILLLHDGINETIEALPRIIESLRSKGFQFVSVQELAKHAQEANVRARAIR